MIYHCFSSHDDVILVRTKSWNDSIVFACYVPLVMSKSKSKSHNDNLVFTTKKLGHCITKTLSKLT
jgi:hypothetical protein